jgi:hypothetical protein
MLPSLLRHLRVLAPRRVKGFSNHSAGHLQLFTSASCFPCCAFSDPAPIEKDPSQITNETNSPTKASLPVKKTKTSIAIQELPQGLIPLVSLPFEDEGPVYPTVVRQARKHMRKFENCILLTRVGGFYELYFEHANEYGPLLGLKVAQKKTNAGPVSMVLLSSSRQILIFSYAC